MFIYFLGFINNKTKVSDLIIRSNIIITNFNKITHNLGELDGMSRNDELSFRIIQFRNLMSNHPICNGRDTTCMRLNVSSSVVLILYADGSCESTDYHQHKQHDTF